MRITQTNTPIMKNAGIMALLMCFCPIGFSRRLILGFKSTYCLTSNKTGGNT